MGRLVNTSAGVVQKEQESVISGTLFRALIRGT
jgi:hypothetical protein